VRFMMFALADILSSAVTPNGLFVYRSKLFGGMSAEVLTIFNKSNLMVKLKGSEIRRPLANLIFLISRMAEHGVIPKEGLPPGVKMGVADAAYIRASPELRDMLYLPVKVPENGDNPRVSHLGSCFALEADIGLEGS
jgi:hypothetical protein